MRNRHPAGCRSTAMLPLLHQAAASSARLLPVAFLASSMRLVRWGRVSGSLSSFNRSVCWSPDALRLVSSEPVCCCLLRLGLVVISPPSNAAEGLVRTVNSPLSSPENCDVCQPNPQLAPSSGLRSRLPSPAPAPTILPIQNRRPAGQRQPSPGDTMAFLQGKKILITGLLSNRSIAYGIAQACKREGAELAFTYVGERFKDRITDFANEFGSKLVFDCDVGSDEQIDALFADLGKSWSQLD